MNIVIGLLVVILALLMVKPVQAVNERLVNDLIPTLVQNSLKVPFVGEVIASEEIVVRAVDGSEDKALVYLTEIPKNLDTQIKVDAFNLDPEEQYIAVYHKSPDCSFEINSVEKSIQGAFYPGPAGNAVLEDRVIDSINRIGSVSLRTSKDFELIACGRIQ